MLRALKRSAQEEQKSQKRLKVGEGTKIEIQLPDEDEMDEDERNKIDITDFEFRMKHDVQRIADTSSENLSKKDLQMLQGTVWNSLQIWAFQLCLYKVQNSL